MVTSRAAGLLNWKNPVNNVATMYISIHSLLQKVEPLLTERSVLLLHSLTDPLFSIWLRDERQYARREERRALRKTKTDLWTKDYLKNKKNGDMVGEWNQ